MTNQIAQKLCSNGGYAPINDVINLIYQTVHGIEAIGVWK